VALGELEGPRRPATVRLASALETAGVTVNLTDRIVAALWDKLVFLEPFAVVGALARATIGEVRASPPLWGMLRQATAEAAAVARARGVDLGADNVERALSHVEMLPSDATASMNRDIVAGRPSELDALTGSIVRHGDELGIHTPVHDLLLAAL